MELIKCFGCGLAIVLGFCLISSLWDVIVNGPEWVKIGVLVVLVSTIIGAYIYVGIHP